MAEMRFSSGKSEGRASFEPDHRDSTVRGPKAWAVRALLMITSGALLATSPAETFDYAFESSTDGPAVTLTKEAPRASFIVTVTANALGPDGVDTTDQASALLTGVISSDGTSGRFVSVRAADGANPEMGETLEVATGFTLSRPLTFSGNCADPTQGEPCRATLLVDFARADRAEGIGEVRVVWSLDFESRVEKAESPSVGPIDAPWSVEIAPR